MLLRALSALLVITLLHVLAGCSSSPPAMDSDPAAVLVCTPDSGFEPLDVVLDASGSTDDGAIVKYEFKFGDAGAGEQWSDNGATPSINHTYTGEDVDYTAEVRVTDDGGNTDTAAANVHLNASVDDPPVAALTADPSSGDAPLDVELDASASTDDGAIVKYEFKFGDAGAGEEWFDNGASPSTNHTYNGEDVDYTAEVRVTDDADTPQTDTQTVQISMGGGGPGDNEIRIHAGYTNPDNYSPFAGAWIVRLYDSEVPEPVGSPPAMPPLPPIDQILPAYPETLEGTIATATFEDVPDGSNYWVLIFRGDLVDWDPATPGEQLWVKLGPITVPPAYDSPDIMGVQVRDPQGGPGEDPVAYLAANPSYGDYDLLVTLDASVSTDDTGIVSYNFDFGEGAGWEGAGAAATAVHTYTSVGDFTARVEVTDDDSNTDIATANVHVTDPGGGSNQICLNIGYTDPGGYTPAGGAPIRLYDSEPTDPSDPFAFPYTFPPEIPLDQVSWNYTSIGYIMPICFENVPDGNDYWVFWHKGDLVDWDPATPGDQLWVKLGPITVPPDYSSPDIMGVQLKEPGVV